MSELTSMMTMGQRIRGIRKEKKITIKDLAVGAGINQGSISLIENGEINPSAEIISKICRFFNISADFVLFGTGIKEDDSSIGASEYDALKSENTIVKEMPQLPIITSLIDIISNDRKIIKDTLDKALDTKDQVINVKDEVIAVQKSSNESLQNLNKIILDFLNKGEK